MTEVSRYTALLELARIGDNGEQQQSGSSHPAQTFSEYDILEDRHIR